MDFGGDDGSVHWGVWVVTGLVGVLFGVQLFSSSNPLGRSLRLLQQFRKQESGLTSAKRVDDGINEYYRLHSSESSVDERLGEYASLVNSYYDLATQFYEWGWCASFHFAYRWSFESFAESIRRHEYYLASLLQLDVSLGKEKKPKVIDVGCGIGGPLRNITKFTRADITGVTLNDYQVHRGNELCRADPELQGLSQCRLVQADFMKLPFEARTFDAAYAIEATCHAPDRVGVYAEILRVLKPGAVFACYEWCMTDAYDASNANHKRIKKQIEEGNGLPDIVHFDVCVDAMKRAGFEVLHHRDMAEDDLGVGGKPWMLPLQPSWNPLTQRFQFNPLGATLTNIFVQVLEFIRLAPKGTIKTQRVLQKGAFGLSDGGRLGIFTSMYLMLGRVPLSKTTKTT